MEASNEKLDNQRARKTSVLVKDFVQVVAESPVGESRMVVSGGRVRWRFSPRRGLKGGVSMRRQGQPARRLVAVAVFGYAMVIVALTTLKAFFQIGYLWKPENQHARELMLIPFEMARRSTTWFGPVFDYVGNIAFFVPMGMLLFVAWYQRTRPVLKTVLVAVGLSLSVETVQYVFELGRTSLDDLWCNALGAFIGAWFAKACGPRFHKVWVWLAIALTAVFAVLVGLGERLGDPDKIV